MESTSLQSDDTLVARGLLGVRKIPQDAKHVPRPYISQKSDSKTPKYNQKVVPKLKIHETIDSSFNAKRNFNPNSNSNQNPNSNPNPNPNPNPNAKQPDPPNPPNQPVTQILNPPIRYSANPGPAECAKRLNKSVNK